MASQGMKRIFAFLLALTVTASIVITTSQHRAFSQDPTTQQKVESEDAHVDRYGNWASQSASTASGGSYLYGGGGENDALALRFYGPSVEVLYVSGPKLGTLAVEVDDTVLRTVITAADSTQYGQSAKINYLSEDWHTLKVYAQAGGTVAIDAFVANLDAPSSKTTPDTAPPSATDNTVQHTPRISKTDHILINEIDPNSTDAIELFNPTSNAVNLNGWQLRIYLGSVLETTFTFPAFYLFPGNYVVVYEGTGTASLTALYLGTITQIESNFGAAISLINSSNQGVDFVRWGGSNVTPTAPDTWTGDQTFSYAPAYTIGRNEQNDDDNDYFDWTQQCPTLGKVNTNCLVLNEFYTGATSAVELYNPTGRTIILLGYQFISYRNVNTIDGTYTFPSATIPAGGYVVLYEGTGTNTATTFYAGFSFGWSAGGGGGFLTTGAGGVGVDFARWGFTAITPAGANWAGGNLPVGPNNETSVQRRPSGEDYDTTSDFCVQVPTLGTQNRPCVLINEIYASEPDGIEIHNASLAAYPLTGYEVILYDSTNNPMVDYTFSAFSLATGAYIRVLEGTGTNTSSVIFGGGTLDWAAGTSGAAKLYSELTNGVDFVRWGTSTRLGDYGAYMTSPNAPAIPSNVATTTLGRNTSSADFDEGADWCYQPITPGTRNHSCAARLAVFAPATNQISLVDSPTSQPPVNTFFTYNSGLPAGGTNGQWVMGDWDGDGMKTPGVYGTNGVFYFTNVVGTIPSSSWHGIWFGLLSGVIPNAPVAGHFDAGVNHDCIGVVDSGNFPPYGVAFVLYFTCDMADGNPPKTFQWLSIVLPDNQGFTGTFQFGTGEFDGNGVDSIAIRRGNFIAYSLTNPTTFAATFPLAQYFAPPIVGNNQFIVGDFDNNGLDSFGLFFPAAGAAYFKNDLDWNSGATPGMISSYFPIGTATTAATWTGY